MPTWVDGIWSGYNLGTPQTATDYLTVTGWARSTPSQSTRSASRLYTNLTTVGNTATTVAEDLHTFLLSRNVLTTNGDAIRIRTFLQTAANGNSKAFTVVFGGTVVITTTSQTFNNVAFPVDVWIFRTGAATQKAIGYGLQPNVNAAWSVAAGGGFNPTTPGETLSGDVAIRITGQSPVAGAANDCTVLATIVDYIPGTAPV